MENNEEWDKMHSLTHFNVGNGKRVQFWKDIWCDNTSLSAKFEPLFQISCNKESTMEEVWHQIVGRSNPTFTCSGYDWETPLVMHLLTLLNI